MRFRFVIIAAASIFISQTVAVAQSSPDCAGLQGIGIPGRLYYSLTSTGLAPNASWAPLPAAIETNGDYQDLQLAYIVPTKSAGETGVLVIKIARKNAPEPANSANGNLRIKLVRSAVTTTCTGRYASDYVYGLFGPLYRPEVNSDVDVADYIYYHKTESDAGQPTIYGFHLDYRDKRGECVSTDDKRNGNRQQFLFAGREPDSGLVIANIKDNLSLVAKAFSAPEYAQELLKDKRTAEMITGYLQYSKLEAQLHEYKYPDSACVAFTVHGVEKGESMLLMLNDLEQRDSNRHFLPAAARREKTVTVQIH